MPRNERFVADVVTLFPEMFVALSHSGVTRRALEEGRWSVNFWNPRDFTEDVHRTVDDRPYGGGPGMVMMPKPLAAAIVEAKARQAGAGLGCERYEKGKRNAGSDGKCPRRKNRCRREHGQRTQKRPKHGRQPCHQVCL